MARNGKIAHLPRHIRNDLNQRLDDGQSGAQILEWLNSLQEVRLMLDECFDGQPINHPNLTAWRQGGFQDWKRHQQSCDWARALTEEAGNLADESGIMPVSDRISSFAGIALGKLLQRLEPTCPPDQGGRSEFHALMKDLSRLRREDHEAARLRIELERYAADNKQNSAALLIPATRR